MENFEFSDTFNAQQTAAAATSAETDKLPLLDSPISAGFENYVRSCFRPGTKLPSSLATDQGVSASRMLKMEGTFGPGALDETYDDDVLRDPLEKLYSEMGLSSFLSSSLKNNCLTQYPVYTPKQSSEYYSTLFGHSENNHNDTDLLLSSVCKQSLLAISKTFLKLKQLFPRLFIAISERKSKNYKKEKEDADAKWRKNNRQMVIDYKDYGSLRLSPYMYQEHPYVRPQDSRIVGSNFVQITSRPKDNFLEKIDKTLAEVRAMPRFY
uniref:Protein LAZY 1-like n=1 Tax=Syphacia muris TaxID=451379 RepID=A0A0N5AZM1_9BILA